MAQTKWAAISIILLLVGVGIGYGIWGTAAPATVTETITQTKTETVGGQTITVTETAAGTTIIQTQTVTRTQTVTAAMQPVELAISVWAAGDPASVTRVDNIVNACNRLVKFAGTLGAPYTCTIEETYYHRGGWEDYEKKIFLAFEAGELPDIIAVGHEWIPVLADKGMIVPLDEYINKYWDFAFFDVPETLWNAVRYKGKLWAIPQDTEARPLYIWKPALKGLGWSDEEIAALPEKIKNGEFTLDDMLEVAKQAVDAGLVKYGVLHRPTPGGELWQLIFAYGGKLWNPDTGNMVLDKEAMQRALEWFYRASRELQVLPQDMTTWSWRSIHTAVVSGETLFWFGGTWHWAEWQKVEYHPELGAVPESYLWENFIFALVPSGFQGGKPVTLSHPFVYVVTSQSENPEGAALVLAVASQPEFDVAHAVGSAHIPVRKSSLEHPAMKASKFLSDVAYMLDYATFLPMHPLWGKYRKIIYDAIAAVELGKMAPADALKFIEDSIKADPELSTVVEIV